MQPQSLVGNKYRLLELLAVGSTGRVWRARNESVDADVVLKILSTDDLDGNEVLRARFRHEAHVGALLQHPGIVRVFDLLEEPSGELALVMEHVRGETLRGLLKTRGSLSPGESLSIVREIALSLIHAHAKGIVHRDIKPTNILLEPDDAGRGRPRLCDFGIARSEAGVRTATGDVVGTPQYMSPEQIVGDTVDGRSDLYSLALVAYECMAGQNPFRRDTPEAAMSAVIGEEIDHDPKIPIHVWGILQRALSKRPYERFLSVKEFLADLDDAIARSSISLCLPEVANTPDAPLTSELGAREENAVHLRRRARSPVRRLPTQAMVFAGLAGLVALGVVIFLSRSRSGITVAPHVAPEGTLGPVLTAEPPRTESASSGSSSVDSPAADASMVPRVTTPIPSSKPKSAPSIRSPLSSPHGGKPKQKKESGLPDSIGKPDF